MSVSPRDSEITRRFAAGATRFELAADFGLSARRISQIAAQNGVFRHTPAQIEWQRKTGRKGGRPRLPIAAEDMPLYVKARRYYGAAYAHSLLGLGV